MVFVYRAAIVAFATFVSAMAGFGLQWLLPGAYVADSKGMIGSVVGLVAALLSIVLGLLIWTSHGLFAEQQSQLLTVGAALIRFDYALKAYGPEAAGGRALLREHAETHVPALLESRARRPIRLRRLGPRRRGHAGFFRHASSVNGRSKTAVRDRNRTLRENS